MRSIYKIPGKGVMFDVPGAADEVPEEGRGGVESKGEGRSCEGIRCEVKSTFSFLFNFHFLSKRLISDKLRNICRAKAEQLREEMAAKFAEMEERMKSREGELEEAQANIR